MPLIRHRPAGSPTSGPYVPAVEARCGGFRQLFVSGQGTTDPATGKRVLGDMAAQARAALENLRNAVQESGFSMNDIVRVTLYLVRMDDIAVVNDVYREYFDSAHFPARSTVAVKELPGGQSIELDAIAVAT